MHLPKLEPKGWRVARSAQVAVSRSHSFPIKPLSLSADFDESFSSHLSSNWLQVLFTGVPFNDRGRRRNHACALYKAFLSNVKLPVSCNYNNFCQLQGWISCGDRCLFLRLSPDCQHTEAPLLLLLLLLISLHVSPPAACPPINHSCVKPQDINPFTVVWILGA